ncbi:MAG: acetyl-coenzyme A synthetase, partial [Gammaproteobacteria bacterium]
MAEKIYPVPPEWRERAYINEEKYHAMYARSIEDPEGFWAEQAQAFVTWFKPWERVTHGDFKNPLDIRWFEGGKLNVSYNCLDRHLEARGDQTALLWEGDDPGQSSQLTYRELHREVCRMANVLKALGVKKGDRVCLYLPMIPELAVAMLACTRIGAIHSVVFAGFSPEALKDRILDSQSHILITADEGLRRGKHVPLK